MANTRILIQHLTGSKANQTEQFPLDGFMDLPIGRDPSSAVSFDPQRDDAVSRRHAIISIVRGDEPAFRIADLGSRNGTFLNGEQIVGEVEIPPGDTVELGRGGPKFCFELQPRPSHLLLGRTRQINLGAAGNATRVLDTADIEAAAMDASAEISPGTTKRPIGRDTVIGLISTQRQRNNQVWLYVLAAALLLVGGGGLGLYFIDKSKTEQASAVAARALATAKVENERTIAQVRSQIGLSAQEIVHRYGNATVVVDTQWRLYDKATGKPLFQMVRTVNNDRLPCFVELPNGVLVRWLTTDDQNHSNLEIGASGRASGVVIDSQGFILTNKHVAAGWLIPYGQFQRLNKIAVFKIGNVTTPQIVDLAQKASAKANLDNWAPGDPQAQGGGGVVFQADAPKPVDNRFHEFEGRGDLLEVRFPGSLLSVTAHLVRASSVADVAEIKIDTQQTLSTVELAPDDSVQVGDKVTVLGYPTFSTQTIAVIQSAEAGRLQKKEEEVPEPTVTDGLVSQKSAGVQQQGKVTTVGEMGDSYQLTVPTGAGNSGGPVFNSAGKVIGLFTYANTLRETVTYAIPIKFGRDLFQVQRAAN